MSQDQRVETWASKIAVFDHDRMVELTAGEDDDAYTVHCLTPRARWLLLTLVSFYGEFTGRYVNWPEGEARDAYSETVKGLINVMACQTDMTRIADATEAAVVELQSLNNRIGIGPGGEDINGRLADIEVRLGEILVRLPATPLDPTLIDQIEEILDGVGTILGAAAVLP
jgi:hypothetical protein